MYGRPTESTIAFLEQPLRQGARHPRRQRHGLQGRLELRRDHRGVRRPVRDQAGPDGARHLPQHHRQPGAGLRPDRRGRAVRAAAVPRLLPDHPGLRHPARAEQAQALRRHDVPGRGRDRRHRRRPRRGLRRRARRHHDVRPGHRAEVRDHRARGDDRAAAAGLRRPARRPLHRPADQDRAGRPAAGDVRPQRRGAGADRRARSRRPTASTPRSRRPGSRSPTAPRSCCSPTATSPTAPSPGRSPTSTTCPRSTRRSPRPQPGRRRRPSSCRTCATPRRWPAVGGPRHAGPRAPHRRPREGRRQRQHLLRPGQPRPHGAHPPGQGRPDRRDPAAARGRRPDRTTAKVLVLGWGSTYGPIGAGCRRVRNAGYKVAQVHLRHLNPLPARPRRHPQALRPACWSPR